MINTFTLGNRLSTLILPNIGTTALTMGTRIERGIVGKIVQL
jgi:hypothetical protein